MGKHPLINILQRHPEYVRLLSALEKGEGSAAVFGLGEAHRAHVAAALFVDAARPMLIVTANETAAARMQEDIAAYTDAAYHFPVRELPLGGKGIAASTAISERRMAVIAKLIEKEPVVVILSANTLLQRMAPIDAVSGAIIEVRSGDTIEPRFLVHQLVDAGYERVDLCEGKGQVCLRGGYVDIFPITDENPVRIEFFDDEVDTLRIYDPLSQRSIEHLERITIMPASEMPLADDARKLALRTMRKRETLGEEYEILQAGGVPQNAILYLPFFYEEASILDYFDSNALILMDEPSRIEESAKVAHMEHIDAVSALLATGLVQPEQADLLCAPSRRIQQLDTKRTALLFALTRTYGLIAPKVLFRFETRPATKYLSAQELLITDIHAWRKNGTVLAIYAGNHAVRLQDMLIDGGADVPVVERMTRDFVDGEIIIVAQSINKGFEYPEIRFAAISESELYGTAQRKQFSASRKRRAQLSFSELEVGDLVVHELHGIGRFVGVIPLTAGGVTRDYLHLNYAGNDRLYIPTDQLDRVQKYVGGDEDKARLSKLGSGEWQRTVARTRESVKRLAFDLVRLYGDRMNRKGFRFSPDTPWQRRLEESFPYEETPDQLTSIAEIKKDMESERVMDRLLCGDVGYGKTEVALRAAFKAVMDGKQVAFLVPTTILAQQHFNTFASRFSGFPVEVALLSRFNTAKEEKTILDKLKAGHADVVIATHKLLGKNVEFHDLGLLIIDEEQRFGVGHKEQIKNLRRSVDVLTLSATPIPRTLHMSLTGIRDMSVIETPPEQRYPVQTYVMEYSDLIAREAILKEIGRGGQVYFVYNKVRNMERFAEYLHDLVPEARIGFAHGQMSERTLEKTMLDFMQHEYDVLLCSTIIESGLDIQNVNTIIVYDSDKMGLSQLYQLRGRVGRGTRLGYAYLTFMRDKVLSEVAEKRLSSIREFTQFGAGFKIAMRDLEIRGAGNLLGPEQHGHMAQVGYDLYCKIVDSAVKEARGEKEKHTVETVMDVPISVGIPHSYVPRETDRLSMYKRIALIDSRDALYDVQDELIDRYGDIPPNTKNLLDIALLKAEASKCFITQLSVKEGEARMVFDTDAPVNVQKLYELIASTKGAQLLNSETPVLVLRDKWVNPDAIAEKLPHFIYMLVDCIDVL